MRNHGIIFIIFGAFAVCVNTDLCPQGQVMNPTAEYCINVEECLKNGYVIYGKVCFSACPDEVLYFENETRTCYDDCLPYLIRKGSYCLNSSFCTRNNEVLYNGTCVPKCPVEAPVLESGVCWESCSTDMLTNGTECISESSCLDQGWVKVNKSCLKVCSSEMPYNYSGTCVSKCPYSLLVKGNTCTDNKDCIASSRFVYRGSCVESCPDTAPYTRLGICYKKCPSALLIHENKRECLQEKSCAEKGMFISNGTCTFSCPETFPFSSDSHCVSFCPENRVFLENNCILKTDCNDFDKHNKVIFEGKCIDTCPPTAPFAEKGYCKTECSNDSLANSYVCIDKLDCVHSNGLFYGKRCLSQCPLEAPYLNTASLDFRQYFSCERECPSGMLKMDNTSYLDSLICREATCKKNIVKGVSCTTEYRCPFFVQGDSCLKKCPDAVPYVYNRNCHTTCPSLTVLDTSNCSINCRTCILQCPSNLPFRYMKTCHKRCPEQTVHKPKGTECFSENKCENKFVYNGTCLEDCPVLAPYKHRHTCHDRCPKNTLRRINKTECVYEVTCEREDNFMYNGTCLEDCPVLAPYKHRHTCHDRCPPTSLQRTNMTVCVDELSCKSEANFIYNGTCLEDCPESAPYKHLYVCHDRCPPNTLRRINKTECFDTKCDQFVYDVLCIEKCPEQAPYVHSKMCLSSCPFGTVHSINKTACYPEVQCALLDVVDGEHCLNMSNCFKVNKVIYNDTCIPACPTVTRFLIKGKCHEDCSAGTIMCAKHRNWILISGTVSLFPCIILLKRLVKPRDHGNIERRSYMTWMKKRKQTDEEEQGLLEEEVELQDIDKKIA